MIRLTVPSIDETDWQAVQDVLESGILVQGNHVAEFEKAVASYVGVEHAVAVSNGTAALHLALLCLGVGPGDLVAVTAYSWIATANVIELCGAQPVFVDINPDTFNMSPEALENILNEMTAQSNSRKRLKAIMPVHVFGQPADMSAIISLAARYDLPVVEDAACALGAKWNGQQVGTFGKLGCFSFHPRKAITTGEGGIVTTNDADLADTLRALRNHGQDPATPSPDFILAGFNYRMTEFQAALGMTQLAKLDRIIEARQRLAKNYDDLLDGTSIKSPFVAKESLPVYQSYVVLLPDKISIKLQNLIQELKNQGIETSIGTIHMPMSTYYRRKYNHVSGDYPITDYVFNQSLTLPLYERLAVNEQELVINELLNLVERSK